MSKITSDRFCPICEQIVPRDQKGLVVYISPARKILLHEGCAEKVKNAYLFEMENSLSESE
jgi:hypothetical protein